MGESIDANGLQWISGASSAVILMLVVYDRWLWRWPLVRKAAEYQGRPVIHGTWQGQLKYKKDGQGNPGTTPVYLSIAQTYSTVQVRGFFTTSESYSLTADIDRPLPNQRRLVFAYHGEAPHPNRDNNRPHDGTAMLNIVGIPAKHIKGSYYTDRGGSGEIKLTEYTPSLSESYEDAESKQYQKLS
jgi:hypothetical protein